MKALVLVRAITTSLTQTLVLEIVALQNQVLFRFTNPNIKYYHSKYFIKKKKKKKETQNDDTVSAIKQFIRSDVQLTCDFLSDELEVDQIYEAFQNTIFVAFLEI